MAASGADKLRRKVNDISRRKTVWSGELDWWREQT
jgi:hypothetical protein